MDLFGWTLSRSTPPRKNVRPGASYDAETGPGVLERLNQLETNVERLQMDAFERQVAVMNAAEKVLHQLRARERKRDREMEAEIPDEAGGYAAGGLPGPAPVGAHRGNGTPVLAHLNNRFRRF